MDNRIAIRGLFFLCLAAAAQSLCAADTASPPPAEVRDFTDDYFGRKVSDPYRWMEDSKSPEFRSWMKAQADHASANLDRLRTRAELLKRLEELSNANADVTNATQVAGRYFYYKTAPGENDRALYVRDGMNGVERVLVDAAKLTAGGKRYSITAYSVSQDARYVSYLISPGGSEYGELRVIEVQSGRDLGERIDRMRWFAGSWLPDGRSFIYLRLRKAEPGDPPTALMQKSRSYLHVLGTDPDKDKPVFGYAVNPDIKMAPALFPWSWTPHGSKYAMASLDTGVSPNEMYYIAPLAGLKRPLVPWKKIAGFEDEVKSVALHGDDLFLLTFKNSPRFRIVRVNAARPDLAGARDVLLESTAVIEQIAAARDALYVRLLDGGIGRLLRIDYKSYRAREIKLPFEGTIFEMNASQKHSGALIGMSSWIRPPAYFKFNAEKNSLLETSLQPKSPLDVSAFESVEVAARSHDGTMVPLSIIYRRGIKRDGNNPTLLWGYGAYGFPMRPSFNARELAWLERGGVLAFAHVRGGGEFGREWHTAGQKSTKPNTWKDFIACADYLVAEKYTSPQRLAGQGRSAGGILVGNAIVERPDLFAAAVLNVGVMNPLRAETTPNGPPNIAEFGSVTTEEGFKGLLAMDAYTRVRDQTRYPAVLLTHGINDPRVEPWHSAKMAARLQAATVSGKPVWLRVDYDAGHGIGASKRQRIEEQADTFAFLFDQLAAPDAKVNKAGSSP